MIWLIATAMIMTPCVGIDREPQTRIRSSEQTIEYSNADIRLFEQIIEAEVMPTWSLDGYLLVAQTVMNQLETGLYGSGIRDVLTHDNNYTVYTSNRYKRVYVTDNARQAVKIALSGSDRMNYGQLYFCTVSHLRNNPNGLHGRSEQVATYENVIFCR